MNELLNDPWTWWALYVAALAVCGIPITKKLFAAAPPVPKDMAALCYLVVCVVFAATPLIALAGVLLAIPYYCVIRPIGRACVVGYEGDDNGN